MLVAAGSDATVLAELGAIILGLAVLGRLAARLALSPIPLYLLAGLALGNGGVVDPVTSRPFIDIAATVGLVLLLLLLGLEYSSSELVDALGTARVAGAVDLLLNFSPGLLAGLVLGWGAVGAVALGGITYISSSGIVAKLLSDLGRTGNRETPVVLSILVAEDLVMAFYLPLLAGLLIGGPALLTAAEIGVAVIAVAGVLVGAHHYGDAMSRLLFSRSDELLLLSILGVTLLVAGAAEWLGVSAAIGAFLVGIAVSGEAADRARPLLSPLRHFFAAAFFVVFGLEVDPATVLDALPVGAAIAALTGATKFATGWWAAGRVGVQRPGRMRAGAVLVARGEFSIVIAGLAVANGSDPDLGPVAAAYVLLLGVAGPLLARLGEPRHDRSGIIA